MAKQIRRELIQPGFCLPGALCDASGRQLLPRGTFLTQGNIAKLGARVITGLYRGSDWPDDDVTGSRELDQADRCPKSMAGRESRATTGAFEPPQRSDRDTVSVASLRAGICLSQEIYDEAGVLLLAAGTTITPRFLHLLQQRGIVSVRLRRGWGAVADRADPPRMQRLDRLLAVELSKHQPLCLGGPADRPQLPLDDLWVEARRGLERHVRATAALADICETSQAGRTSSSDEMGTLVGQFADMLTLDCELLIMIVSMQRTLGEYLFDHCVNVALLSMSIASQLGLRRERLMTIGLGGVFQDVGMLGVPSDIRLAPRELEPDEQAEIEQHPVYTLDYLERVRGLPVEARFIGYQAHERTDGSGYPRRRSATTTHPFAKVVALADAYAAMTRPRPYRPARRPHDAVKEILVEGSHNRFDRTVVRGFLDAVSAFPVGSRVELTGGVQGLVVRANPGAHTRPVVAVIDAEGNLTGQTIDLSKETRLEVVAAGDSHEQVETGLSREAWPV